MKKSMLRYLFVSVFVFASTTAYSIEAPRKIGFGGAGRSGILQEALYTNPAALAHLQNSLGNVYYGMPQIRDWNAGGRQISAAVYDGTNQYARAGLAYERDSHAYLTAAGNRAYRDRTTVRFGAGRQIFKNISAGVIGRYVTRRDGGDEDKFVDGDAGVLFPVFTDLEAGITYENFAYRGGESPPTGGIGVRYLIAGSLTGMVDYGRVLTGDQKNKQQWNYALEVGMGEGLIFRGGLFQNSITGIRGTAAGLSWQGPRTSFDYGVRISRHSPVQREHLLGMTVQL